LQTSENELHFNAYPPFRKTFASIERKFLRQSSLASSRHRLLVDDAALRGFVLALSINLLSGCGNAGRDAVKKKLGKKPKRRRSRRLDDLGRLASSPTSACFPFDKRVNKKQLWKTLEVRRRLDDLGRPASSPISSFFPLEKGLNRTYSGTDSSRKQNSR